MPLADWIHKYPQVQVLLQQPEEVLEYEVDRDVDVDVETIPPRFVYRHVEQVLLDIPGATLGDVQHCLAYEYGMTLDDLAGYCPRLPQVYAQSRRKVLLDFQRQLAVLQRVGLHDCGRWVEAQIQAWESVA
jgi:hypothetical protein